MKLRTERPANHEFAPYYARYVARVPEGDVLAALVRQGEFTRELLARVDAGRETYRYAEGKWSVRQVIGHLSDAERVFAYRMLRFSRRDETPLPSFDEDLYAAEAPHGEVALADLAAELYGLRQSTVALLSQLPEPAWIRQGTASDKPVSVRALAWITAGHELHHLAVLAERYGVGA